MKFNLAGWAAGQNLSPARRHLINCEFQLVVGKQDCNNNTANQRLKSSVNEVQPCRLAAEQNLSPARRHLINCEFQLVVEKQMGSDEKQFVVKQNII